ncbi:MAG: tRNA lysidine(34) synthetase TilS [Amphiplicatus sp.]
MTALVTVDEFATALAALGAPRRFIVALSGGPDSVALMRLAAAMRADALAVTVDHGLRADSRREAEAAGAWAGAAGLGHIILGWDGEKPKAGRQAAARAARYRLLADFAAREGYEAVLTGHNADDQAETVFMRLARGAGPAGLAGMERASLIAAGAGAPLRLLRPLLDMPRARLRATLTEMGQPFIDDPSNDDPAYERVRTRALLAALEEQKLLTRAALCRTARRMRAAADRLEAADRQAFETAGGRFCAPGWVRLSRADIPASLAARLIRAVGAGDYAPAEEDAAAALQAARATGAATLGGAVVKRGKAGLSFCREPAALLGRACVAPIAPLRLAPGARALWDGRFILTNEGPDALAVIPMGELAPLGVQRRADEAGVPVEAMRTAPWPAGLDPDGTAADRAGLPASLRVEPLIEERFSGRIVRFS